jgi:hypothetical protein
MHTRRRVRGSACRGRNVAVGPQPNPRTAVRYEDDVLDLRPFTGRCGGAQVDPSQHLAQYDPHLHHRERRPEAAADAAAERQKHGLPAKTFLISAGSSMYTNFPTIATRIVKTLP